MLLCRQHTLLTVEFVSGFLVYFRSTQAEVGGRGWASHFGAFVLELGELTSPTFRSSEASNASVLAGPMHSLSLEIRLASKGDISFIPVESLVKSINHTILALVCCINGLVDVFVLNLAFLLSHQFQLIFITFELQ